MSTPAFKEVKRYTRLLGSVLSGNNAEEGEGFMSQLSAFDPTGRLLSEIRYSNDGSIEEAHRYTYDSFGNLLEHRITMPDDGIEEYYVFERNKAGETLSQTKYYSGEEGERLVNTYHTDDKTLIKSESFDADGEFEQEDVFVYDASNRLTERIRKLADGTSTNLRITYNADGHPKTQEETDGEGKALRHIEYSYDEHGREILARQFNPEGKSTLEIRSEYDNEGRLTCRISKGFHTRVNRFIFNEQGLLTEESLSDENNFVITRNRYEYDAQNRLSSELVYETDLTRGGRDTHQHHRYDYSGIA